MKRIFTLMQLLICLSVFSQSTTVVISQAFGGGGGTGYYKHDYVELYNKSAVSQSIAGFTVAYGSSTGQFGSSATNYYTIPASTSIPAGKYFLIQLGSVGSSGLDLPTPDLISTNCSMSGTNGKVALVTSGFTFNTCGATATPCTIPNANIIDLVAWGSANNSEGGTSVNNGASLTSVQGCVRKSDGFQDTDNNNADFDVITNPVPRNSLFIMPLNLKSFNASLFNNKASLSWNTANEINVNGFSIEKSNDGRTFTSIGFVAAKNAASASYSFSDVIAAGANYYRLKITDKDGSFKYSTIVTLNTKTSIKLDVYPNPVVNGAVIAHTKAGENATVKLITIDGKTVLTQNIQAGATQSSIDVSKLVKGNYLIVFENDGTRTSVQFVKQ